MSFCQPCRNWVGQHKKAARWVAFLLLLSLFFTLLGQFTTPINAIGFCKVYP
ncbi:hypothetical protein [Ferribacterium limneticum]|jgi:hypothetical protein|uniref:hypothetical protein n=1 Tax=Ferribacterium limneticum TaxID=76259 RepID=UPI0011D6D138|nr:hypothetical protein [Ferribacterium limneticum]TXT29518.1 MAG: hypothetical protein FD131_2349 [Rhodocyclaceae bacterium]UCV17456.1 hypothetical protein KI610_11480 [Ferribacterium limneticum]